MKRKYNKSAVVLLVCLILVLTASVGSTMAYLFSKPEPQKSEFAVAKVECEVVSESDGSYTVKNTGNVDAYVRVKVVATWKKDGNVHAQKPDCTITTNDTWFEGEDGYYYYTLPIEPNNSVSFSTAISAETLSGYTLSVDVLASAIQAKPAAAVTQAWNTGVSGVDPDGHLIKKTTP